jgi:hypothetical protein
VNGVGRTAIEVDGKDALNVIPAGAHAALSVIDEARTLERGAAIALRRTEFGAVEAEVAGLTRWNDKRALIIAERLSGNKITCVLSGELADRLGPEHRWSEAWDGGRVLITGALHYGDDGVLKRVTAESLEPRPYTDVSLASLRDIDILQGKSVAEHIRRIRGGEVG